MKILLSKYLSTSRKMVEVQNIVVKKMLSSKKKKCTDCSLAFDNCLQHVQPLDDYVIVFMRYRMSNSSVCIL